MARWQRILPVIAALELEFQQLSARDLRKRSLSLRYRAKSHEPLGELLPESFALVREAARRTLNMRHFDVQLLGGMAMHERSIAEMQTGEGKTLTATLPLYLHALTGRGAHLATVNDYLARRDAEWMRPVYEALGLTVGVIEAQMQNSGRREAYACDITYGTAKEFGFDFLRDRLLLRRIGEGSTDFLGGMLGHAGSVSAEKPVQREAHFVLVDEADSILIDDAGTPLIIGALPTEEEKIAAESHRWSAAVVKQFVEDEHYEWDHDDRRAELTSAGRQLARGLPLSEMMHAVGMTSIYEFLERAIKVEREYILDRHYVVRDGEIQIVDEFTGRIAEGRKWRDGIHQAVEAKQGVTVTTGTGQAARITVQDFFLRYKDLAGMTGTAVTSAGELARIYDLRSCPSPPTGRRSASDTTR
jgi:preprotein translocase subunit SecA